MLCITTIINILINVVILELISFPNIFNIFLYIVLLSIFPVIALFSMSDISISSNNSPPYFLVSVKNSDIPKFCFCSSIISSVFISVACTILGRNI